MKLQHTFSIFVFLCVSGVVCAGVASSTQAGTQQQRASSSRIAPARGGTGLLYQPVVRRFEPPRIQANPEILLSPVTRRNLANLRDLMAQRQRLSGEVETQREICRRCYRSAVVAAQMDPAFLLAAQALWSSRPVTRERFERPLSMTVADFAKFASAYELLARALERLYSFAIECGELESLISCEEAIVARGIVRAGVEHIDA